jgi:SAM-dependent methyltransferase
MINFGLMPTYIGCVSHFESSFDSLSELRWGKKRNGLFGVIDPPEFSKIYLEQHNEVVGKTWIDHHQEFFKFIQIEEHIKYLEIGSGSGILINLLTQDKKNKLKINWDSVDPNPDFNSNPFGTIYRDFFPQCFGLNTIKYDVIVHSHLIEHVEDPLLFLEQCNNFLVDDGTMYISLPNMSKMKENFDLNVLMFEHLTYLPENELLNLLSYNGFEILNKFYFNDHSIFLKVKKMRNINKIKDQKYKSLIQEIEFQQFGIDFYENLKSYISACNKFLDKDSKKTFIFGAHIFTQYLIYQGLSMGSIELILDNAEHKNRRRLYGTNLKVYLPTENLFFEPVNVIVAAGQYESEIIGQLKTLLKPKSIVLSKKNGIIEI